MNATLPDNFKQLSVSQQAIYAAEALREAAANNVTENFYALRKPVRQHFDIPNSTADRAERLLKLCPELAAQVKAGTRPLPKSAKEGKGRKGRLAPPKEI